MDSYRSLFFFLVLNHPCFGDTFWTKLVTGESKCWDVRSYFLLGTHLPSTQWNRNVNAEIWQWSMGFWSSKEYPWAPHVWTKPKSNKPEISTESQQAGTMSFNPPGCQGDSLSIAGFPFPPKKTLLALTHPNIRSSRLTVAMRKQNSLIHSSMGLSEKRVSVPPKFHGWYSSFLLFAGQHLGGILTRYFPAHCPHGALPSMPVFLGPGLNTCKDHHHLLDHCHPKDPFGWNLLNPHGDASNILWKIPIWMGFVQKVIQNGRYWVRWYPMDPDGPIAAWFLMCFHRFPAILTTFSNVATP